MKLRAAKPTKRATSLLGHNGKQPTKRRGVKNPVDRDFKGGIFWPRLKSRALPSRAALLKSSVDCGKRVACLYFLAAVYFSG